MGDDGGDNIQSLGDVVKNNDLVVESALIRARSVIENFMFRCSDVGVVVEFRALRNLVTELISDLKNPYFSKFNASNQATVDDFLESEKRLVECVEEFNEALEELGDSGGVDVVRLKTLLEDVRRCVEARIPVDAVEQGMGQLQSEMQTETQTVRPCSMDESPDVENSIGEIRGIVEISDVVLSELTLYLGLLHTKYASFPPEVLHDGSYVRSAKWEYQATDRRVIGRLKSGFFNQLLELKAQWLSVSSLQHVIVMMQDEHQKLRKGEWRAICLIGERCSSELKNWIEKFTHPRMALYFYELNTGLLIYNQDSLMATHYEFWFNKELKRQTLYEQTVSFVENNRYFTCGELAEALCLKTESAKELIRELEQKNLIVDVSFENDSDKKYTKC